jgi:dTDP-4-dehydrorhamnose reductase
MSYGVVGLKGLLALDIQLALTKRGRAIWVISTRDFSLSKWGWTHAQKQINFNAIYNASGYTAVDKAESDQEEANLVNGEFPGTLALAAKELGARFVHISTDYVFDGSSNTPYKTTDIPNPQSAYGRSKLAGEVAVQESGADYQIFRTAWLYGANGNCFPKTVARVLREQGQIKVVADQIGQPTWTRDLAELIIDHQDLEASARPRIVHGTASGNCSWYEFACEIALSLGYDPSKVIIPITTAEYPTPAKRPAYSVLDNVNETGLIIGNWRDRWKEAAPLVLAEYL